MTPKEKALELVDKYQNVDINELEHCWVSINGAKRCALIAVDEILHNDGFTQFDQYLTEYWQEVKQEIENL
jgi:hypothetical protein